MSVISKFFKTAATTVCLYGAFAGYQRYQEYQADLKLSPTELTGKYTHRYWDQVAATTNVCTNWSPSAIGMYDKMPDQLRAIPTKNVDPGTVMAVQKYLAPGIGRFSNYEHMKSELPLKILISVGAAAMTFGGSEVLDGADVLDGLDALIATADVAGDLDTAVTVTDAAGEAIDLAELSDAVDVGQLAGITDKIEMAGGLEAVMGQTPSRGFLGISATMKWNRERKRVPEVKHIVANRVGRARRTMQKRYGGTFQAINLNMPGPCR